MLNKFPFRALLLLFVFAAPAAFAQSDSAVIKSMLQERDKEIKTLLGTSATFTDAQRTQLQTVVNGAIDFDAMAKAVAGNDVWADLSAKQRTDFTTLFADVVRAQSLADLDAYRATVRYGNVDVTGTKAVATTTTSYKGKSADVIYHLHKTPKGWLVTDIFINDVGTVEPYAKSFRPIFKRANGYATLMKALQRKLDKLTNA